MKISSRYLAVVMPLKYDKNKVKRRLPYIFVGIWILSAAIISPVVIMSSVSADGECSYHVFDDKNTGIGIFTFWLVVFLLVPTLVMFFTYVHMIIVISRSCPQSTGGTEYFKTYAHTIIYNIKLHFLCNYYLSHLEKVLELSTSVKRTLTMKVAQMNVIQTCVIVCIFFVFTMTFSCVCDALIIFGIVDDFSSNVWTASVVTVVLNSCINPFIYTIR